MKIYLVGGAVRDELLKIQFYEHDWVVVGATVAEMEALHYRQVGKDFPVFLHPKTNEEYALARKERKTKPGYTGFAFDASKNVTLEEDLLRRDLTINAIAKDVATGEYIDPYQGKLHIAERNLRHVSEAFVEDPVRILRVARFAARFHHLGFTVDAETMSLMRTMVSSGEVNALVPERVWKELEKALQELDPKIFFEVLRECHAAAILFPEIDDIALNQLQTVVAETRDRDLQFGDQAGAQKLTLNAIYKKDPSRITRTQLRFAGMLAGISEQTIAAFCERYRVPTQYTELAKCVSKHLAEAMQLKQASAEMRLDLLYAADAFRRTPRFKMMCEVWGYLYPELKEPLQKLCVELDTLSKLDFTSEIQGCVGKAIGEKIYALRLKKMQ